MDASDTALHGQNTTAAGRLYMALELGEKRWKLSLGDGRRAPSRYTVAAGDTTAVLAAVANARARCHLGADAPGYTCYEAGRDGFWLHRWLMGQGIANLVVDSASIEVNRRARRAKTDRLDSDKLFSMLIRYYTGERRVWAVARMPTPEQEDDRRLHRELERQRHERVAHTNLFDSPPLTMLRMPDGWQIPCNWRPPVRGTRLDVVRRIPGQRVAGHAYFTVAKGRKNANGSFASCMKPK
ncbi:hypothetical protein [Paraburkholderia sp. A1RO-5L]|uniref:hypothetical protein n=1 Tax=Paraburkholderia sp. A1RO-5L TaxID=3028370 RepID=UPI003B7CC95E